MIPIPNNDMIIMFAVCRSSLLQPTVNCNIINQSQSSSIHRYNDDLVNDLAALTLTIAIAGGKIARKVDIAGADEDLPEP